MVVLRQNLVVKHHSFGIFQIIFRLTQKNKKPLLKRINKTTKKFGYFFRFKFSFFNIFINAH